jgi:hypothetical protein
MTLAASRWLGAWVLAAVASAAGADQWDEGSDPDRGPSTDNVLFHGSRQTHDLGVQLGFVPDQDWYRVSVRPFSSYQFLVDAFTGDLDLTATGVQRLDAAEAVQQSADVLEDGGVLSLTWFKGGGPEETNFVRVSGAACSQSCNLLDTYGARFYETTYAIPRFNNSGSQTTVLLVQNATDRSCALTMFFLDSSGAMLANPGFSVGPRDLLVFPTAGVATNVSGSVRVAHTCGYGGLSGKAVSVEPATGFTFDTPMVHRPH